MSLITKFMKTSQDPRHQKRQIIVKELFSFSFQQKQKISPDTKKIIADLKKIDELIEKAAPQFPISKLNKIDLAILRLAVFELKIEKKQPAKVIIDEAIELAKEYAGENSPKFINGALGTIIRNKNGKLI